MDDERLSPSSVTHKSVTTRFIRRAAKWADIHVLEEFLFELAQTKLLLGVINNDIHSNDNSPSTLDMVNRQVVFHNPEIDFRLRRFIFPQLRPHILSVPRGLDLLPIEILAYIFGLVTNSGGSPQTLASICRLFRTIVLGTATLWTKVSTHQLRSTMRAHLERSRDRPLEVRILQNKKCPRGLDMSKLSILTLHAHRWEKLHITDNGNIKLLLRPFPDLKAMWSKLQLPALKELHLDVDDYSTSYYTENWVLPDLQRLIVTSAIPKFNSRLPVRLFRLEACYWVKHPQIVSKDGFIRLFSLLRSFDNLQEVTLDFKRISIESIHWQLLTAPIHLPSLRIFSMRAPFNDPEDEDSLYSLFNYSNFVAPVLEKLTVSPPRELERSRRMLLHLFAGRGSITTLRKLHFEWEKKMYTKLCIVLDIAFEHLPQIEHIIIAFPEHTELLIPADVGRAINLRSLNCYGYFGHQIIAQFYLLFFGGYEEKTKATFPLLENVAFTVWDYWSRFDEFAEILRNDIFHIETRQRGVSL